jgi:hypothetical protein
MSLKSCKLLLKPKVCTPSLFLQKRMYFLNRENKTGKVLRWQRKI